MAGRDLSLVWHKHGKRENAEVPSDQAECFQVITTSHVCVWGGGGGGGAACSQ